MTEKKLLKVVYQVCFVQTDRVKIRSRKGYNILILNRCLYGQNYYTIKYTYIWNSLHVTRSGWDQRKYFELSEVRVKHRLFMSIFIGIEVGFFYVRVYWKLVRTPLNVYFTAFKSIFLSLSMHLLPPMNVMLDFIWTLPVHLRGTRNNWT